MHSGFPFNLNRLPRSATFRVGLLAGLTLVVPPLLFGPWLPFLDLIAFVGLDNIPAAQSYGPLHYGVFQFSYIVHYALSRAMLALGIATPAQIVLFYLLQGGVFFLVIWRLLVRLVPEAWLCSVAIALGTLAFWDGFFLWGGPLPFSLAAASLTAATFFTLREAEAPAGCNPLLVPLLSLVALMCHPFALLFALVLAALRGVFVPARRLPSAGLVLGLLLLGWIIRNDSSDTAPVSAFTNLFTWPGAQVPDRLVELFTVSNNFAHRLFGFCPPGLQIYFALLGAIHLLGFVASPVVVVLAQKAPALRLLAALNTVVAALYFCSVQNEFVIPGWPWRILTFHSPLLFVAGVACPLFLLRRWQPALLLRVATPRPALWAVPVGIAGLMFIIQVPLLRLGENVGRSYERTRTSMLQSGVANAFGVVADIDNIEPFYLRCVPFLLCSDPQLLARNVHLFTEWHIQNRHPTRLTEAWFDLGRRGFQASFFKARPGIDVRVVPQPMNQVVMSAGNNQGAGGGKPDFGFMEFTKANTLIQLGCVRDAIPHYEAALRVIPGLAEAHNNLGVALLSSGRQSEAIERFAAATQLKPDFADAQANLGIMLVQVGRPAEARPHLQIALRLKPDHAAARANLERANAP